MKKRGELPGVNLHEWASKTKGRLPEHVEKESALYRYGYLLGYMRKQAGTSSATAANEMNTSQDSVGSPLPAPRSPSLKKEVVKHQTLPAMDTGSAPGDATPLAFTMSP
jgi:hypothetical protein